MNAEQRLELIRRIADWCYDNTESWTHDRIGLGLAYLFWAIAAGDGQPLTRPSDRRTNMPNW